MYLKKLLNSLVVITIEFDNVLATSKFLAIISGEDSVVDLSASSNANINVN